MLKNQGGEHAKKFAKSNPKSLLNYIINQKIDLSKDARFNLIFNFCDLYTVVFLCALFKVSRSGYYKWRNRKLNPKPDPDLEIKKYILEMQLMSNFSTGYRKMYKYLVKYNNLIKGDFSANIPNTKWCIDITKIDTQEARLYFCAIIDLFDRSIVSYAFHTKETLSLVSNTVANALKKSNIDKSLPLILHSDQGTQFTSKQYKRLLKDSHILGSMSKKGSPNDNAVIESFFASLKKECVYRKIYKTKKDAIKDIEFYIFYYNNYRIHLKTGVTPLEMRKTTLVA